MLRPLNPHARTPPVALCHVQDTYTVCREADKEYRGICHESSVVNMRLEIK